MHAHISVLVTFNHEKRCPISGGYADTSGVKRVSNLQRLPEFPFLALLAAFCSSVDAATACPPPPLSVRVMFEHPTVRGRHLCA